MPAFATPIEDQIMALLSTRGGAAYFGEPVTQLEHALQAAYFAEQEKAPPSLITAALLHDVGHLLHNLSETVADEGLDTRHEELGHAWLIRHFGPEVYEPVRMHVAAKRYLCATDPSYLQQLSPASLQSLRLQGGPTSDAEVHRFEAQPFFREAVRLRLWDDRAKIAGLLVPGLEHYREILTAARSHSH